MKVLELYQKRSGAMNLGESADIDRRSVFDTAT
jgi:hypothetical protein